MNWVFLRGWSREARHWGGFPAQFREALPEARVHALDLPGNGARHAETSPTRVDAMVEALRERLRADGIGGPYRLLGLSLGGMLCVDWASRHPAEVASCILVNTSMRPFSRVEERLRPASYRSLLGILLQRNPSKRETAILGLTSAGAAEAAELIASWTRYGEQHPVSRLNALRQLVAAARFRAPDWPPPVPLLALAGSADRLVDPQCSKELSRRWRVPLVLHPGAGHDLPLDDGPWVAAQVKRWLGGLP